MTRNKCKYRVTALLLVLSLLLAACGSSMEATYMRLKRAEGEVEVLDGQGKNLIPREELGLFDSYQVGTGSESYAWIDLDSVKLTKMDQNSRIQIRKEDRQLEIEVEYGSLFFNITEPLEAEETLNIRTSTMAVGIRGTCGWVEVAENREFMRLFLLEGEVECTAGGEHSTVTAGETAVMTESGITVTPFYADEIPGFVLNEITEDKSLIQAVLDTFDTDEQRPQEKEETDESFPQSDMDGEDPAAQESMESTASEEEPVPAMTPEVEAALTQYREIVGRADSYDYQVTYPPREYRYALVQMQTEYSVPALLLMQICEMPNAFNQIDGILIFQYYPDTGTVVPVSEALQKNQRNVYDMAGDGNGIFISSYTPGTINGSGITDRVWLDGDTLNRETLWSGDNTTPDWTMEEIGHLSITWYNVEDASGLDSWIPVN